MQRLKQAIAFFTMLCLMFASIPFTVFATNVEDFEFSLNSDNTVSVTKYNGSDTDIVIPSLFNGRAVTAIGERAFAKKRLQTVTFPETLTTIHKQAFESCIRLKSVILPDSVTTIEEQAFFNCSSLVTVEATPHLQFIGSQAFDNTRWIVNAPKGFLFIGRVLYRYIGIAPEGTVITIPDFTASISANALEGQYNITRCYIPVGLRSIGDYAFSDCARLEYIRIPPSVSSIGTAIFLNSGAVTIHGAQKSSAYNYAIEGEIYFSPDSTLDYLDGDLNKDGTLSSDDIRLLMKTVVLSEDCDHERYLSCDIVFDGKIATSDIREWMMLLIS